MFATSFNHFEILVLYEESHKYGMSSIKCRCPKTIYENNAISIAQLNVAYIAKLWERYIKGDKTSYTSPKLFYSHEL